MVKERSKSKVFSMSDLVNDGATKQDSKSVPKKDQTGQLYSWRWIMNSFGQKQCDVIIYAKEIWTELGSGNE